METKEICLECKGEVKQHFHGDEGWGVCEECGMVEGETEEVIDLEYSSNKLKRSAKGMIDALKELSGNKTN